MSDEQLREVFGEDVASDIERQLEDPWTLDDALTTDWTRFEQEPPESLDKPKWTRKLPVTPTSTCELIVDRALDRSSAQSPSHTVKQLARYGLPRVISSWEQHILDARQFKQAARELSTYTNTSPNMYSFSKEVEKLQMKGGRTQGKQEHWRVIWYQKISIAKIADTLGIHESDLLARVIFEAGRGLEMREQRDNIEEIITDTDRQIEERVSDIKRPVSAIVLQALQSKSKQEAAQLCKQEYPRVWDELEQVSTQI